MSQVFGARKTVFLLGEFLHWVPHLALWSVDFVGPLALPMLPSLYTLRELTL